VRLSRPPCARDRLASNPPNLVIELVCDLRVKKQGKAFPYSQTHAAFPVTGFAVESPFKLDPGPIVISSRFLPWEHQHARHSQSACSAPACTQAG